MALSAFETLFALALNLERGGMEVLDGFRTSQSIDAPYRGTITVVWNLLGEEMRYQCAWHSTVPPRGPVQLVGMVRNDVVRKALDILETKIGDAITAKEARSAKP